MLIINLTTRSETDATELLRAAWHEMGEAAKRDQLVSLFRVTQVQMDMLRGECAYPLQAKGPPLDTLYGIRVEIVK